MDILIQTDYITSGLGGGGLYLTGQYIRVIANGAVIRAEVWSQASGGTLIGVPSGGPDLVGDGITVATGPFSNPVFCSGSDQVYYTLKNEWPYAVYHVNINHPSCAIVVCDLSITGSTVVNETTYGAFNGSISLTYYGTNGAPKYSLDPSFNYVDGQDSPFTGLSAGTYTIYAKDPQGCIDSIIVAVGVDYSYGVRWRGEYSKIYPEGHVTRVDIEERDYSGLIEEVCFGGEPITVEYNWDEDNQLVPSEANLQLLVPVNEEGKFDDIRTGFDRQFSVKKYIDKDDGNGFVLDWFGYITPEFYQEQYLKEPYYAEFKAVDGLGILKNKSFVQLSGEPYLGLMSLLKIITECLKKLPIQVNVRQCINIYEDSMVDEAGGGDPLAQAYIKADNFKGKNCEDVINDILSPFTNAELFQSFGVWWIRTNEQSVYTSIPYREFDKEAEFVSYGTQGGRIKLGFPVDTTRINFTRASQILSYTRNYGKFTITHDLQKDNNMIDSGGFETDDVDKTTHFFKNWNLFPLQTNVSSGLEYVDNGGSKGAFFFQWAVADHQKFNSLVSIAMPIDFGAGVANGVEFENKQTSFKLKFQVYVAPRFNVNWVWFGWKLRFTNPDTGDFQDWFPPTTVFGPFPDTNVERINEIYLSSFSSWQTFEFYGFRPMYQTGFTNQTVQLSFYFHNHMGRDYDTVAQLRAVPTVNLEDGKRVYIAGSDTYGYELQSWGNDLTGVLPDDDGYNQLRPDDYAYISNQKIWAKIAQYNEAGDVPMIDRIMIDNVSISIFTVSPNLGSPGFVLVDPPETITYEQTTTDRNENVFNTEVSIGDAPNVVGAGYIYNGYLLLSDGTNTQKWARSGITESDALLAIYLKHLASQGSRSLRVLSGSGIADVHLGYINSLIDRIDNRKYRFTRFSIADKLSEYNFDTREVLTGAGDTPVLAGEFNETEFNNEEFYTG